MKIRIVMDLVCILVYHSIWSQKSTACTSNQNQTFLFFFAILSFLYFTAKVCVCLCVHMHVPGMVKVYTGLCLMDCFLPNEDIREAEWAMGLAFVCMCMCVCVLWRKRGRGFLECVEMSFALPSNYVLLFHLPLLSSSPIPHPFSSFFLSFCCSSQLSHRW